MYLTTFYFFCHVERPRLSFLCIIEETTSCLKSSSVVFVFNGHFDSREPLTGDFTLKSGRCLPALHWFFWWDLIPEEDGLHDDNFKIPTVARADSNRLTEIIQTNNVRFSSSRRSGFY